MTNREELIWVAALLEGEGCFRIKPGSTKGYRPLLVVNVGSTDQDVVKRCTARFSGHGKIQERVRPNRKALYSVEWYGIEAEKVMKAVLPFMCSRRTNQINNCLAAKNLSHHDKKAKNAVTASKRLRRNGRFVKA